ncbi:hypothetical protein HU200_024083 [Digitaria exilis]|uniref:Uncharacterized protein n=1 Tax=Digitaria exilis TaxID=1010633 RepID=A0A835EVT8_9POAL|nr:hypothetical protein HU200_024083 [Digitaria exilis]
MTCVFWQSDVKHVRLTVRGASQKKIQDAIHFDLVPAGIVDYHRYSKGPDGSSFTVEVGGRVDVGRLHECLKKLASNVKIEAVVPEDLKAKMAKQEQDLSNMKKRKDELKSKLVRAGEENYRLQAKLRSVEEENKKLHKKIKDRGSNSKMLGTGQLEGHVGYRQTHISIHELEVDAKAKLKISQDGHRRIK